MNIELKEKFYSFQKNDGLYCKLKGIGFSDYLSLTCSTDAIKSLDLYCPVCKQEKTFVFQGNVTIELLGRNEYPNGPGKSYCGATRLLSYECPTCGKKLLYAFYHNGSEIVKIAQYPSFYDVSRDELKKYKKNDLIDEESFNQIYKADICASSGYFVAAYTYMRRVYETLMLSVFKQNETNIDVSEEEFKKLGGHDKIQKIRSYLAIDDGIYGPLYSLLSGGIHTYTEEECSDNYAFLKIVLLDVLAEQKAKKERESNRQVILKLYSKMKSEGK